MFTTIAAAVAAGPLLIHADVVHPVSAPPITDGYVLIRDGTIAEVGPWGHANPTGDETIMRCAVLTPGLVDARATVGLTGQYNIDHDQDMLERSSPIQPQLRALDAYNPQERLVEWVRSHGTTTVHTGHAPGELISGRTMICKTTGNSVDDAVIIPDAMVACTLGESSLKKSDKSPGTRSKSMSLLRQRLLDAQNYLDKRSRPASDDETDDNSPPGRDLELEALGMVLDGDLPLLVHAHRSLDIMNAIRLGEEFDIEIVIEGGAEAYRLVDEIAEAEVPVIVHPTMIRMYGERENATFTNAAQLASAGVEIAMQTGYESYVPKVRVLVFEAGHAAVNGLGFDRALRACTLDSARLLGIDERLGSLDVGKDADLALWDGDPFEWTTHCTGVVIDGEVVSDTPR